PDAGLDVPAVAGAGSLPGAVPRAARHVRAGRAGETDREKTMMSLPSAATIEPARPARLPSLGTRPRPTRAVLLVVLLTAVGVGGPLLLHLHARGLLPWAWQTRPLTDIRPEAG